MDAKPRLDAHQWLYNAPVHPNALAWSQDDLLAIATSPVVVLLNPFDLKGPRCHVNFAARARPAVSLPGCHPQDQDASLQFSVACMKLVKEKDSGTPPTVRSLAWSPSNCGPEGSCLLATVLSDNQVHICGPPVDKSSVEWKPFLTLTDLLRDRLLKTEWKKKPKRKRNQKGGGLRLRGGACEADEKEECAIGCEIAIPVFKEGSLVEVAETKPSSTHAWHKGEIKQVSGGFGLIEYVPARQRSSRGKICEWFQLPGFTSLDKGKLPISGTIHDSARFQVRPSPPQNISHVCLDNSMAGRIVEYDNDGRWILGKIKKIDKSFSSCSIILEDGKATKRAFDFELRWPMSWYENEWKLNHDALSNVLLDENGSEDCRNGLQKSGEVSTIELDLSSSDDGCIASRSPIHSSQLENRSASDKFLETDMVEEHSTGVIPINSEDDADLGPHVLDTEESPSANQQCAVEVGYTEFKETEPSKEWDGKTNVQPNSTYSVPEDFDKSVLGDPPSTASRQKFMLDIGKIGLYRWLTLRSMMPDNRLPRYAQSERLRGVDLMIFEQIRAELVHAYADELAMFVIPGKEVTKQVKANIRRRGICSQNTVIRAASGRRWKSKSLLPLIGQAPSSKDKNNLKDNEGKGSIIPAGDANNQVLPNRKGTTKNRNTAECDVVPHTHAALSWSSVIAGLNVRRHKSRSRHSFGSVSTKVGYPVSNSVYRDRLSLLSATCVAWSPILNVSGSRMVALAVGTESGHIVLWRFPCSIQYESEDSADAIELMGLAKIHSGGVSVLEWVQFDASSDTLHVVLASGGNMGDIRLTELDMTELDIDVEEDVLHELLESLLKPWGWVCPPDLQPVTCLSVTVEQGWDTDRLVVVAGKTGGAVVFWSSPPLGDIEDEMDGPDLVISGDYVRLPTAHSAFTVTGVASGLAGGLIASTGMDCNVKCWRKIGKAYIEIDRPDYIDHVNNGNETPLFGIARSQNGLLLVVLKDGGLKLLNAHTQKMSWKRVAHSTVELMRIRGAATMFKHALSSGNVASKVLASLTTVSDVAATMTIDEDLPMVSTSMPEPSNATEKEHGDAIDTDGNMDCKAIVVAPPRTEKTFLHAILYRLEEEIQENDVSLSDPARYVWSRLSLAVALQRMVLNCSVGQERNDELAAVEVSRDMHEFLLLQKHIFSILQLRKPLMQMSRATSEEKANEFNLSLHLMIKWVLLHHQNPHMQKELVAFALEESSAPEESLPFEERDPFSGSVLEFSTGSPVESVRSVTSPGTGMELDRCAASMLACVGSPCQWECLLCNRKYRMSPQQLFQWENEPSACIFCGLRLSQIRGEFFLPLQGVFTGSPMERI